MASKTAKEPPLPADLKSQMEALMRVQWDDDGDDIESNAVLTQLRLDWKTVGNDCYGKGLFLAAIRCYTRLLELPGGDTAQIRSNRSAAYLQSAMLAGPSLALKDAEKAVELEPDWFKAHLRVGDAQRKRGQLADADAAYRRALSLQSDCAAAQAGLCAVQEQLDEFPAAASTVPSTKPSNGGQPTNTAHTYTFSSKSASRGPAAAPVDEVASELTPEQLVQRWKAEIVPREDRTGCRPHQISLAEADRQRGAAVKEALLARFRAKVDSDDTLNETLRERREQELLRGDKVDYREADRLRHTYANGTNAIGLGISSDAFKEYTGRVDHRTW